MKFLSVGVILRTKVLDCGMLTMTTILVSVILLLSAVGQSQTLSNMKVMPLSAASVLTKIGTLETLP